MIKVLKEINRSQGYKAETVNGAIAPILAGQLVWLKKVSGVNVMSVCKGEDDAETMVPFGFALDSTVKPVDTKLYKSYDGYSYNDMVAAHIGAGGLLRIKNDGTGAVFATDVVNAAPNTKLFVDALGKLTITQGDVYTVGNIAVGSIETAPTSADGALVFKTLL